MVGRAVVFVPSVVCGVVTGAGHGMEAIWDRGCGGGCCGVVGRAVVFVSSVVCGAVRGAWLGMEAILDQGCGGGCCGVAGRAMRAVGWCLS